MSENFFDKVYGLDGPNATRRLYDDWSKSYDAEVAENGYATPGRVAEALSKTMGDTNRPILDFGCGTGISGAALKAAGFTIIDGVDISDGMLEMARARTGLYRSLTQVEPGQILANDETDYAAITAIGVIGAGAAPLETLDLSMDALSKGAFLAFSFNDHTLEDPAYEARVMHYVDAGTAALRFKEYGPHLPGRDINSTVYVLEKEI